MKGSDLVGWCLAAAGVATPFVILWLRHKALAQRVTAQRLPTEADRIMMRRRGRLSIMLFVLFWPVAIGLAVATSLLRAPKHVEWAVFASIVVMAAGGIAFQLGTLCPICGYRLGYQKTLGVPSRCERCGAQFS